MKSLLFIYEHKETRRADLSTAYSLLITSVRSVVAERCRGLQIPHSKGVLCSLDCPLLHGIACGLGSSPRARRCQ